MQKWLVVASKRLLAFRVNNLTLNTNLFKCWLTKELLMNLKAMI